MNVLNLTAAWGQGLGLGWTVERGLQQGTQQRDMCDRREVQGYLRTLEKPKPGPIAAGAGETQAGKGHNTPLFPAPGWD